MRVRPRARGSCARADPRSRARRRRSSASRTRGRRGARGRPAAAARGRRAPRCTSAASAGGSSPTRSPSRDRRPGGTCTAPAAGCRSAAGAAPSSRGSAPGRPQSDAAARAPPSGTSTHARPRRRGRPSRDRSSPAALSVNVTATSSAAGNAPLATCQAIRRVIVVVLPVPAPARMQTGPRVASTAARCSAFSPAKIRSASKDGPPYRGRSAGFVTRACRILALCGLAALIGGAAEPLPPPRACSPSGPQPTRRSTRCAAPLRAPARGSAERRSRLRLLGRQAGLHPRYRQELARSTRLLAREHRPKLHRDRRSGYRASRGRRGSLPARRSVASEIDGSSADPAHLSTRSRACGSSRTTPRSSTCAGGSMHEVERRHRRRSASGCATAICRSSRERSRWSFRSQTIRARCRSARRRSAS